jgi:hypothetical protein
VLDGVKKRVRDCVRIDTPNADLEEFCGEGVDGRFDAVVLVLRKDVLS